MVYGIRYMVLMGYWSIMEQALFLGQMAGRMFLMRRSITAVNFLLRSPGLIRYSSRQKITTKTSCVYRILSRWSPTSTCVLVIWCIRPFQATQATPYKRKPPLLTVNTPIVSVAKSRQSHLHYGTPQVISLKDDNLRVLNLLRELSLLNERADI